MQSYEDFQTFSELAASESAPTAEVMGLLLDRCGPRFFRDRFMKGQCHALREADFHATDHRQADHPITQMYEIQGRPTLPLLRYQHFPRKRSIIREIAGTVIQYLQPLIKEASAT